VCIKLSNSIIVVLFHYPSVFLHVLFIMLNVLRVRNKDMIYIYMSGAQGVQQIYPTYTYVVCVSSEFEITIRQLSVMGAKISLTIVVVLATLRTTSYGKIGSCHIHVNHAE